MHNLNEAALLPQLTENEDRRKRWSYLTKGIETGQNDRIGFRKRIITEQMLDNMARYLEEASTVAGQTSMTFTTFALPLVRRVYPRLLAADLFTVQPMTQPTGMIFYLDFKRTTGGTRLDAAASFSKTYADSSESSESIKEVELDVSSETVTAVEKKLKAIWTVELQQDLKAYHGLDAETELMTVAGDEITREIDRILIDDCKDGATAGNTNWSTVSGSTAGDWVNQEKYNETFYHAFIDANNAVFKKRYRNTNWAIADPDTCARLEKLQGFALDSVADNQWNIQNGGRHLFGTLKSRWLIYKDPWFTANTVLLGYKGDSFLDAGYVYAPYIPFYVTPMLIDPNDFKPRRGMMSRYAKKMVVGDMYATITITSS